MEDGPCIHCHSTPSPCQGVATSSIGALLRGHGFRAHALNIKHASHANVRAGDRAAKKVTAIKMDPYINIDAGLMSPPFNCSRHVRRTIP